MNERTKLKKILQEHLDWHGARTEFAAAFVLALLRVRTVSFPSLALALNPFVKQASNERRLQRFFAQFQLNLDAFARLLVALVPTTAPFTLTLDRTHWQVGRVHLNVLLFGVVYQGVAFPIVWKLLGKAGNSNQHEREQLLFRLLQVIPASCITVVLADREFIGEGWFETLERAGLTFVIRIRKNARVTSRGRTRSAGEWIGHLAPGTIITRCRRVHVYGHKLFLSSLRRRDGDVIVLSNHAFPDALTVYSERWSIETLFQNLKTRGFKLEATRLEGGERVERLLALLALTFAFAYRVGEWLAERTPIRLKPHGRKERSVFRLGLDYLAHVLLNLPYKHDEFDRCIGALSPLGVLSGTGRLHLK